MNLELQREILAAIGAKDDDALAKIAAREGIDPDLWAYWLRTIRAIDDLAAGLPTLVTDTPLPPPSTTETEG